MSCIINNLNLIGHYCLVYADGIVIFSYRKSLNSSIDFLNTLLKSLYKALISTRRCYNQYLDITINVYKIPFVSNYTYLGFNLDTKLRGSSSINDLTGCTACWFNFFRSVSNLWLNSHLSILLSIYKKLCGILLFVLNWIMAAFLQVHLLH